MTSPRSAGGVNRSIARIDCAKPCCPGSGANTAARGSAPVRSTNAIVSSIQVAPGTAPGIRNISQSPRAL